MRADNKGYSTIQSQLDKVLEITNEPIITSQNSGF